MEHSCDSIEEFACFSFVDHLDFLAPVDPKARSRKVSSEAGECRPAEPGVMNKLNTTKSEVKHCVI